MLRLSCIAAILFAIVSISAQVAPGPRAAQNAAPAPTPPQDMVKLQYPNSDVADILRLYEQLTGKKLVVDNFVQGKVSIFIAKDVPRDEAIKIIEMNLSLNGFSLVPADNDIIEVVGTGRNPRSASVPIISDESEIPPGDQVISYLFKLRYADTTELQQALVQYLSGAGSNTAPILALPKSGSLLVTQSAGIVRRLVKIVDQIDNPPAEVVSEFIKLERADATKVVDMLDDIFEKKTSQQGAPGALISPRGVRQLMPPVPQQNVSIENDLGTLTALSEDSVIIGKIKLAADIRTNRIHVITRPVNMPFIRKLIAEFDANVEFAKPVTRPLRYISAAEVLPVLVQSLTEPGMTTQGGEGGANPNVPPQPGQARRTTSTTTGTNSTGNLSSSTSESTLNISEELSTQAVDTTPKAVTVGNAKIIADQRANTIIVLGNREVVVKVGKILDEMDVKAPQVALSTVIGELRLNNDEEFGVDYFLRASKKFAGTTNFTSIPPAAGVTSAGRALPLPAEPASSPTVFNPGGLISFTELAKAAAGTAAKSGNLYLAAGNTLAAVVRVLDTTGRFKVISRPMVFTSNNKKAIIASGTEIPVPVSTLSSFQPVVSGTPVNNFGTQSSIQFKKVALQLEVVPLINSESEVSLDILQKIDSVNGSQAIDGNNIPIIATRYIRTNVSAANGSTIVLGGLITDSKDKTTTGIPILDRIPYIGALFRNTTNNKIRTELIILMRPEVTLTKLDLYRLRQKAEERTHFGPELEQDDCPDCPTSIEGKELPPSKGKSGK